MKNKTWNGVVTQTVTTEYFDNELAAASRTSRVIIVISEETGGGPLPEFEISGQHRDVEFEIPGYWKPGSKVTMTIEEPPSTALDLVRKYMANPDLFNKRESQ
jgi:hypothetical protein